MAMDMFIKIGKIKGEARDKEYSADKGWIDILAWSWGGSNSGSAHMGGGLGAGKVNMQDLSFTHYLDIATPDLQSSTAKGTHHDEAQLIVRKAGDKPFVYLDVKLTDVLITSFSTGGSGGEDRLTENISLSFAKVELTYNQQSKTGKLEKGASYTYDIAQNFGE